jgi:sugar phosphate permease
MLFVNNCSDFLDTCPQRKTMQQETVRTRPRFFHGYWIIMVGFICQLIMFGTTSYSYSLFVVPLQAEFGWSRATIMIGNLIFWIIVGVGSPFMARLVSRWGAKWIIAAGALIAGVGFALRGLSNSLPQFYLTYAVVGIGMAAAGVVPNSMVIANWFKKRRGLAIGILGTGVGVGGLVMPGLLSNFVMPGFGWRGASFFSGIVSAAIIIPLSLWLVKDKPEDMGLLPDNGEVGEEKGHRISSAPDPGIKFNQARKIPVFWLLVIVFSTFGFGGGVIFQSQVPNLQDVGFTAMQAALAMQFVGIGSAIGKFTYGWVCDYIPPKYVVIIGSAFYAGALFMLMNLSGSSAVPTLALYGMVSGLGSGAWLPAISMNTSYTFGLIDYGVIFGIYNFLFQTASSISPIVAGHIFDTTGSYRTAFLIALVLFAVAVVTIFFVRRTRKNEQWQLRKG